MLILTDISQFGIPTGNSWSYGSTGGYAGYLPGPLSSCSAQTPFAPPAPPPLPSTTTALTSFAGAAAMNTPSVAPDSTAGATAVPANASGNSGQQDAFSAVSASKILFLNSTITMDFD